MAMMSEAMRSLNRLAKWRVLLAGWQLGTRVKGDPECDAVKDHREVTLLMRAELSALVSLLVEKGVFTAAEYETALGREAELLSESLSQRFPGVTAVDDGLHIDPVLAKDTMKGWRK